MNGVRIMARIKVDKIQLTDVIDDILKSGVDFDSINKKLSKNLPKQIVKLLRRSTPKDTGDTADAWQFASNGRGFIVTNKRGSIIEFLAKGVKPHKIEMNKSVLMFETAGSVLFAHFVDHPGYPKQMEMKQIFKQISMLMEKEINKIIDQTIKRRLES